MKRRNFLKLAGGTCLAAAGGRVFAAAAEPSGNAPAGPRLLDPQLLRNRNQNRSTVACRHGIVCSSQPLASMAGVDMLKAGGNADRRRHRHQRHAQPDRADECGPGGDLFAIIWSEKEQKLFALNASGRAPTTGRWRRPEASGSSKFPRRARCRGACPAASAVGTCC